MDTPPNWYQDDHNIGHSVTDDATTENVSILSQVVALDYVVSVCTPLCSNMIEKTLARKVATRLHK